MDEAVKAYMQYHYWLWKCKTCNAQHRTPPYMFMVVCPGSEETTGPDYKSVADPGGPKFCGSKEFTVDKSRA